MADMRAINKITKMLSLAFKNSNKEEATSAFRQAYGLMQRESVTYEELFNVEIYEGADPKASNSQREAELVSKYNSLLERAKQLKADLELSKSQKQANPALEAELAAAYDQVNAQASEILRLRDELKDKKYSFKDIITYAGIGAIAAFLIGYNMVEEKRVYVDRPVPTAPAVAPSTAPTSPSFDDEWKASHNTPTTAYKPITTVPKMVKSYVIKYGSTNKATGKIEDRQIITMDDGSIDDDVHGKSKHISGDQYKSEDGKTFQFEEINDGLIRVDGENYLVGSPSDISLKDMAKNIKSVHGSVLNDVKMKGIDCFLSYNQSEFVSFCAVHDKLISGDINGITDTKEYTYTEMLPDGSMKYVRDGSKSKYVSIQGSPFFVSDRSMNNYVSGYRGNPVEKLN